MSRRRSPLLGVTAAELQVLEALFGDGYPDDWRTIATVLFISLRAPAELSGLADARRAQLALQMTDALRAEIGGTQPYLSKGVRFDLSLRDRQILDEFNGRNHDMLARKYDLTPRQIYSILDEQLRLERARRQGTLPLDPPDEGDDQVGA